MSPQGILDRKYLTASNMQQLFGITSKSMLAQTVDGKSDKSKIFRRK